MSQQRSPFSKIERWCLGATVCCGLILLAAPIWWQSRKDIPLVSVPTPRLPNPNAFDIYTNASSTIVQANVLLFALRSPREVSQSARAALRRRPAPVPTPLGGSLPSRPPGSPPVSTPLLYIPPVDRIYSLKDKAVLVRQNAAALNMLRQGLQHQSWNPPVRNIGAMFPGVRSFRYMAQLLALEAQVRRGRGDWYGSTNSSLDGLEFGNDIQRGGLMMAALVGLSCESITRREAWPNIQHLTARQARAAARRLESIVAGHVTAADVLLEEKWTGQASLMQFFATPNWQQQVGGGMGPAPTWRNGLSFLFLDKKRVLDNYTRYMDVAIANEKLPYRAAQQPLPSFDDPISQMFVSGFYNPKWSFASNETHNGLLLLALALRAYRLEQNAYPKSLSQLSPRYLKATPRDPLAHNLAFRYKPQQETYILYSVGPDGNDNNGEPIAARQASGRFRNFVQEHSRGDIVAGVNRE